MLNLKCNFFPRHTVRQDQDRWHVLQQWSSWVIAGYRKIWWEREAWNSPRGIYEVYNMWNVTVFFLMLLFSLCMFLFGFESEKLDKMFPEPSKEIWNVFRFIFLSRLRFGKASPILASWKLPELLPSLAWINKYFDFALPYPWFSGWVCKCVK